MILPVKFLTDRAILPQHQTENSAGLDLHTTNEERVYLNNGETKLFGTGIAVQIPIGHFGLIAIRSSIGTKKHVILSNTMGIIDSDYRGEIKISLTRLSVEMPATIIEPFERVAQLIITPYVPCVCQITTELTASERNEGGFGSTGRF